MTRLSFRASKYLCSLDDQHTEQRQIILPKWVTYDNLSGYTSSKCSCRLTTLMQKSNESLCSMNYLLLNANGRL